MNVVAQTHFFLRAWRYRLRSEKFGISYLLSRDLRGKTAIDIGANRGIYSYWMCRCVRDHGHVIAFEPQPELVEQLDDLRHVFGLRNLEIAGVGLSSRETSMTLRRPKDHWGGASLEPRVDDSVAYDRVPVKVTTLDAYSADHPRRPFAFIKCDVEGHEHDVFRGARAILLEDRPDLLFECFQATEPQCEVFSLLQSLDYEGYCFFENGFAPISEYRALRPRLHKKAMTDFVFVPKERPLLRSAV